MMKTRVYEVARDLGMSNRDILSKIASLGIQVRNHMSSLEPGDADRVKRAIEKEKQQDVVEERIRPTVVRRRSTRRAAPEPPAPAQAEPARAADVSESTSALEPQSAPEPVAETVAARAQPTSAGETPASAAPVPEQVPEPTPEAAPEGRVAAQAEPKAEPKAEPVTAAAEQRPPSGARSYQERLGRSDLPPGVVTRGKQTVSGAAQLSAEDRARIVSEHQARVGGGGPTPPRRRELVRSAIGPTGRQQPQRGRPGRAKKLAPGKKSQKTEITTPSAAKRVIRIEGQIGLQLLAARMSLKATDVLMRLMQLGMSGVNINSTLDVDTAKILASEFGFEVEDVAVSDEALVLDARGNVVDDTEKHELRAPVVTVMGHVDHGKTSLLDSIRQAEVAAGEAGGITQHLGAYRVETAKGPIVFLDTPGHAAFTAMRARGATATDVVVLVVAADDGVMPQTKEAIHHAKDAGVPIVVAVNKCDKEDARPEVVMRDLASEGLQPEEWGGEAMFYSVSAKTGDGIDKLLEGIVLQSELLELKANPTLPAEGIVLEAYLDKGRGPVANILVKNGTLETGGMLVAGPSFGKVRAMTDDRGQSTVSAGPATPVEVLGLDSVPGAGDTFTVVTDAKAAQSLAERRKAAAAGAKAAGSVRGLDDLLQQMKETDSEELKLVVKADVQGSAEALVEAVSELTTEKVKVNVIHSGAGGITENDVMLAAASKAMILGFHVRATGGATKMAKTEGIEIRAYNIIYEAVDDVKAAMIGLLKPEYVEKSLGTAQVRQTFSIPKGVIAGCIVTDGKISRSAQARLVRDSVPVWDGSIKSLRRVKDDVREVGAGLECGVGLEGFNDIKESDVIECFEMEEVSATL